MKNILLISIFSVLFFTACNKSTTEAKKTDSLTTKPTQPVVEKKEDKLVDYKGNIVIPNPIYDNFARYIAHLPVKDKSYDSLTSNPKWLALNHGSDSIWQYLDANRFSKMRKFASSEFSEFTTTDKSVLYPFSGPDFVNAFTFFPNGKTFTLMALEPVGSYIDFTKKSKLYTEQYLESVNEAVYDLYRKSYFITQHMGSHLQKHKANGALPLLTLFIVRTGNKILNIQKVNLDSTGNYTLDSLSNTKTGRVKGVKIDFVNEKNLTDVKSVFYFQADITDPGLTKNKGLIPFLKSQENCVGYFKSASYCCFDPLFTSIKKTMMEKCDLIVQDDTGIPYAAYKKKQWNVSLYGTYEKPVKDFDAYTYQKDLENVYKDSTVAKKPLPFSLGYHWQTKNQNLMLFKKIK